jgi:hypothetical protein
MRGKVRHVHLARASETQLVRKLENEAISSWPRHFKNASVVLIDEKNLSREAACSVIIGAVKAALICSRSIDLASRRHSALNSRRRLGAAFSRIAKCSKRASATLRARLDHSIVPLLGPDPLDFELIESIVESVAEGFAEFTGEEAARTALKAMCGTSPEQRRIIVMTEEYSALDMADRQACELALQRLANSIQEKTAFGFFAALSSALGKRSSRKPTLQIHHQIVKYVLAVGEEWRKLGLKFGRGSHAADGSYRSPFHRFCDIILTAMVEPWALRHDIDKRRLVARSKEQAHAKVPRAFRKRIGSGPRASDHEWLVSEDHVRKALQKIGRQTP